MLILTDDQRFDELGFLNADLETPAMDRLAQDGVFFQNAFVTTSLCSPSRASILTGQYAHEHGIVDNLSRSVAPGTVFFPQHLQDAGYQTAFIGKWHMGRHTDDEQPGFDRWVSFAGQGQYLPDGETTLNIDGVRVPQKGYITDELTDFAIDWLDGVDTSRPFFLYLSHKAVHDNFTPAERHEALYADTVIELPESAELSVVEEGGKPLWVQNQRNSFAGIEFPYHSLTDVREVRRSYRRTLSAVDESLAAVRSRLETMGVAENTIIIYMGDNGFMFGEHGLIDKRNAYESSMRIPLIVGGADFLPKGAVVDDIVLNIDIAPTVLDVVGLNPPEGANAMTGLSFNRQLRGQQVADWREDFLYEYFWEWVFPQIPTTFALRGDRYKLIQYHGIWDTDELYDIENDPNELVNLINDPDLKPIVRQKRQRLYALITASGREAAVPFREKQGPGLRLRLRSGSETADFPDAILRDPDADDLEIYRD
ncbi:MAG: sulfatase [Pseudomonadota bacterium]